MSNLYFIFETNFVTQVKIPQRKLCDKIELVRDLKKSQRDQILYGIIQFRYSTARVAISYCDSRVSCRDYLIRHGTWSHVIRTVRS